MAFYAVVFRISPPRASSIVDVFLCVDFSKNFYFFFSSRRRHTRLQGDWSSDVCSSDLADATRLSAEDRRASRGAETQEVAQLIRTFNRARRSNRLYVRLSSADDGAIVNGEPLAALPPSVLAVLEADRNSGTYTPLRSATRGEWEVPVELAVSGSRQLTLNVDQP